MDRRHGLHIFKSKTKIFFNTQTPGQKTFIDAFRGKSYPLMAPDALCHSMRSGAKGCCCKLYSQWYMTLNPTHWAFKWSKMHFSIPNCYWLTEPSYIWFLFWLALYMWCLKTYNNSSERNAIPISLSRSHYSVT